MILSAAQTNFPTQLSHPRRSQPMSGKNISTCRGHTHAHPHTTLFMVWCVQDLSSQSYCQLPLRNHGDLYYDKWRMRTLEIRWFSPWAVPPEPLHLCSSKHARACLFYQDGVMQTTTQTVTCNLTHSRMTVITDLWSWTRRSVVSERWPYPPVSFWHLSFSLFARRSHYHVPNPSAQPVLSTTSWMD